LQHPATIDLDEYEHALGAKIAAVLPNDYSAIQQSIAGTGPVRLDSLLGKAYLALAGSLAGHEMPLKRPDSIFSVKRLFSKFASTPALSGSSK
jgi:septum formation inhibitor-activating ATPase MinD